MELPNDIIKYIADFLSIYKPENVFLKKSICESSCFRIDFNTILWQIMREKCLNDTEKELKSILKEDLP